MTNNGIIEQHPKVGAVFVMPENLNEFFKENNKAALAFSGGVDSSYLLYAARAAGADVKAFFVKSAFQPQFELDDAKKIAELTGMPLEVLDIDILSDEDVAANPENRCYFCKKRIFSQIMAAAKKDGYELIIDGTNASDDEGDRPGMKALKEMKVKSPLKECGLTKDRIRKLSYEAGLFTYNKPSYACLATRIPTGEIITEEKLRVTEKAEKFLSKLGFSDFRIRMMDGNAKIQVKKEQMNLITLHREDIYEELMKYYKGVYLDMKAR